MKTTLEKIIKRLFKTRVDMNYQEGCNVNFKNKCLTLTFKCIYGKEV